MSFNATAICSKTATATLLSSEQQVNVSPAAATVLTLPAISALAAAGFFTKAFYIQNVDGAFPVTITADTTKPDYIVSREKTSEAGPVQRLFASVVLTGATDYALIEADPIQNVWVIKEMGLSTSYHGAKSLAPQEMNLTLTGTSDIVGLDYRVNDITTGTGTTYGMKITKQVHGAKSDGYSAVLELEAHVGATQTGGWIYGLSIDFYKIGSPTLTSTYFVGVGIEIASDIAGLFVTGIYISKNNTTAAVNYDSYIHCAAQGTVVQTGSTLIHLHGARHPQFFLRMSHLYETGFFTQGTGSSGAVSGYIAVSIGGVTKYIRVHATAT